MKVFSIYNKELNSFFARTKFDINTKEDYIIWNKTGLKCQNLSNLKTYTIDTIGFFALHWKSLLNCEIVSREIPIKENDLNTMEVIETFDYDWMLKLIQKIIEKNSESISKKLLIRFEKIRKILGLEKILNEVKEIE